MRYSRGSFLVPVMLALAVGAAIAGAVYYTFSGFEQGTVPPLSPLPAPLPPPPPRESVWQTYKNSTFGIKFKYPKDYILEEKEVPSSVGRHTVLILTENTEENRLLREGKLVGREGPAAITFGIFPNNSGRLTPEEWVRQRSDSHFKLSDGSMGNISVDEREAVVYHWNGLYKAESVAIASGGYMFLVTGTYINPNDRVRQDFSRVLTFIQFMSSGDTIIPETALCGIPGPACLAPAVPDCQNGAWVCVSPGTQ